MSTSVILPFVYFADPTRGRPLFNASVFIGEIDQDPELFPVQAYHRLEDGTEVPVLQPLVTGPGGIILINGTPADITVQEAGYSMRVKDNLDTEVYLMMDVTGEGTEPQDTYVLRAGDTMTGPLTWLDAQGENRMQTIEDVGYNGWRVFDLDGVDIKLAAYTTGAETVLTVDGSGNYGFTGAIQDSGQHRFIIQASDNSRKMVLGSPWPSSTATDGYDHLQMYFHRDTETSTPFFVAETGDIVQAWIGPDGGASFTGAVEVRNFEDTDTGGYGLYGTNAGRAPEDGLPGWTGDTSLVINPALNIMEGGVDTTYYSGEVYIDTRETSGAQPFNRFVFAADGAFITPSDIIIHSGENTDEGSLQIQQLEATSTGEGWYQFYVTNATEGKISGADLDGNLVIKPASEIGGTVTHWSGEVTIQTSPYSDNSAVMSSTFRDNGDLEIPGVLVSASSIRYKENIQPYHIDKTDFMALNPVTFERKDMPGRTEAGFIAEEIAGLGLEEFVARENGAPSGIAYAQMTAMLVARMQEQQEEIDALRELVTPPVR